MIGFPAAQCKIRRHRPSPRQALRRGLTFILHHARSCKQGIPVFAFFVGMSVQRAFNLWRECTSLLTESTPWFMQPELRREPTFTITDTDLRRKE